MNLNEISAAENNPRKISTNKKNRLKYSLSEFGDLSGIIVCRGKIVSGHQRMSIFKADTGARLDIERYEAPEKDGTVARGFVILSNGTKYVYREVNWTEGKVERALIAANAAFGEWDADVLQTWDESLLKDWGVKAGKETVKNDAGEVVFSREIEQESNYVVLTFKNRLDFTQFLSFFELEKVYSKFTNGEKHHRGLSHVVEGVQYLNMLLKNAGN